MLLFNFINKTIIDIYIIDNDWKEYWISPTLIGDCEGNGTKDHIGFRIDNQ